MEQCDFFRIILDAYVTCDIRSFPIDCIEVIKRLKIPLFKYSELSPKKKRECYRVSNEAFKLKGKIYYNDAFPYIYRQHFTLMHEVGHILLGHVGDTKENDDEADDFASHFLAPRILIHKYGYRDAEQLHGAFGLSYKASNKALISYKEWFRNISYSITRKPTEPELRLEHIFFPESNLVPLMEGTVQPTRGCYTEEDEDDYSELDERSDFMRLISRWHGDCGFGLAENKWLYGNDL